MNVVGYDRSERTVEQNLRSVLAALAYDNPMTKNSRIAIVNQAIEISHLVMDLLCPMQLQMNNIRVSKTQKFLTENLTMDTHTTVFSSLPNLPNYYTSNH